MLSPGARWGGARLGRATGVPRMVPGTQRRGGAARLQSEAAGRGAARSKPTRGDVAVDVGGAIEGVHGHAELALLVGGDDDRFIVLLGHDHGTRVAVEECVDEDVVGQHVELLLVVPRHVLLTCKAEKVGCRADTVRYGRRARAGTRHGAIPMPALRHARAVALQAMAIALMRIVSSWSAVFAITKRLRVL